MTTVLITGCHGLLGQKLVESIGSTEYELHGVDLHPHSYFTGMARYQYHRVDITDRKSVFELVRGIAPDYIVNTAAMTQVDACEIEREKCWNINVQAVRHLVDAARRTDSHIIQISSDYIFDGAAGPYSEINRPNPISYYGKSKLASENLVMGGGIPGTVVRTMVLFGHGRNLRPSFVSWIVSRLRERSHLKVVTDQTGNVTLVDDLASAIRRIIQLRRTGLYHVAGREIISRYDFAVRVAEAYGLESRLIRPTLTRLLGQAAPRPLQSGLIVYKAQQDLGLSFRNVHEALQEYRRQEATLN